MSDYRRANTEGGTYFFTVVAYRRQPILCDERVRTALREGIKSRNYVATAQDLTN
jgi:putative transposase